MIDDNGWVRLHRKIQQNPLWRERRKFSKAEAWIDLIMEARHSEDPAEVLIGSHLIECTRGQTIKSMETWARRWNWSKPSVNRFFDLLSRMNQIRKENVTKTTRITICNYETYNPLRNDNETIMIRKRNASETQVKPNNNVKNEKNEKNGIDITPFTRWDEADFRQDCETVLADDPILEGQAKEDFIQYWSEPNQKGRLRVNLEKTWQTSRRMKRWAANNFGGKPTTGSNHDPKPFQHRGMNERIEIKKLM